MDIEIMAAGAALVGLIVAFVLYKKNDSIEIEDKKVAEITQEIQDGAMAFLYAEYKILSVFVVIVAGLLYVDTGDLYTPGAFLAGAVASVLAGYSGMRAATSANGRTAMAAKSGGQPAALAVSLEPAVNVYESISTIVTVLSPFMLLADTPLNVVAPENVTLELLFGNPWFG